MPSRPPEKSSGHLLDPAYHALLDEAPQTWTLETLPTIRERVSVGFEPAKPLRFKEHWIHRSENDSPLRLCIYAPHGVRTDRAYPSIFYIHGGGFVLGKPEMADEQLAGLAETMEAVVVAVDYRLAPEHSFPVPLEDCFTGLTWLIDQAESLSINPQSIVLMGHSAGGGLTAALALLARERGLPTSAGQILVYPMLDSRTGTPKAPRNNPTTGEFAWTPDANGFCWECLQGQQTLDPNKLGLFSPSQAADLTTLPPAFIAVGALDLFFEESLDYARSLSHAGVAVELHVYPGVTHMFDLVPSRQTANCNDAIKSALEQWWSATKPKRSSSCL